MKITILFAALAFVATTSFAAAPPALRKLKAGQSAVVVTCANVGDTPNEVSKLNGLLSDSAITADGNVEIDAPFTASAPSYSAAGNGNAGYVWCVAVTVTKQ